MKRIFKVVMWLVLFTLASCSASPTYPSPIYKGHYEGEALIFNSVYRGAVQVVQDGAEIHALFTVYGVMAKLECWVMTAGNLTCRYDEPNLMLYFSGGYTGHYWTGVVVARVGKYNETGTFRVERVGE